MLPKIEWVATSMIGQWIHVFFRRGHPKLRNRPTILVSLESTGPYQRNGISLVFMRCVVLEIQLFFRLHTTLVTGNYISEVHGHCGLSAASRQACFHKQALRTTHSY